MHSVFVHVQPRQYIVLRYFKRNETRHMEIDYKCVQRAGRQGMGRTLTNTTPNPLQEGLVVPPAGGCASKQPPAVSLLQGLS